MNHDQQSSSDKKGSGKKGVLQKVRKVLHRVLKKETPKARKIAILRLKKGIEAYNVSKYDKAEHYFRDALSYDKTYARAFMYLGNAMYKMQRANEAMMYWKKAMDAEPRSPAAQSAREKLLHLRDQGKGSNIADLDFE
jgi:tetratricopeptide (TPR) repeat protein